MRRGAANDGALDLALVCGNADAQEQLAFWPRALMEIKVSSEPRNSDGE
jgi:hypothetical protein